MVVQRRAIGLINDPSVSKDLISLAHRQQHIYIYISIDTSTDKLSFMIPLPRNRIRTTWSSNQMHSFTAHLQRPRISHFAISFIPRVSKLWNSFASEAFLNPPNLQHYKSRINKLPCLLSL